jgi:hypothetical protein
MTMLIVAMMFFTMRMFQLHRLWGAPVRYGEEYFMAQRVKPGFYREAGAALLKRWRMWLMVWSFADAPLALWLAATWRHSYLVFEQLFVMIVCAVVFNIMAVHFAYRAAAVAGTEEERPAAVQLSMTPRRLRDHMKPALEAVVVLATLLSLGLLARVYMVSAAPGASHGAIDAFHRGVMLTVWILYWQIGCLLLRGVFIRWRMPLPANRTEDFRRWRAAWLSHHLRIFDAARLLCALTQLGSIAYISFAWKWPNPAQIAILGLAVAATLVYCAYLLREHRRIKAAILEMKPLEMVKEFPRPPVATGRYLAGGFIYFNPENPGIIVRGVRGVAINLGHRSTYAWAAYILGLAALMAWMSMIAH